MADSPQPGKKATSLKQIAEIAGVHVTTVSLALRNSPQLPPDTRKRLQRLAQELGYKPNPMIVALMQQRRRGMESKFQGSFAFITRAHGGNAFENNDHIEGIYTAAKAHALEYGYKLDHFETYDYDNNPRRLEKALYARNIRGLLFPPPEDPDGSIVNLNWEHFAPVTFSTSIVKPAMDRVDGDHHHASRKAFQICVERNYKRLGFISPKSTDIRTQGRWRAGFLASQQDYPDIAPLPVLVAEDRALAEAFADWYARWRPDVLLGNGLALRACVPVLKSMGVAVPEETALVGLNVHQLDSVYSGMYTLTKVSAERAIDLLMSRIQRNSMGLPEYPQVSITTPVWHEGQTLPIKGKSGQPARRRHHRETFSLK